jgi:hypothetical protein
MSFYGQGVHAAVGMFKLANVPGMGPALTTGMSPTATMLLQEILNAVVSSAAPAPAPTPAAPPAMAAAPTPAPASPAPAPKAEGEKKESPSKPKEEKSEGEKSDKPPKKEEKSDDCGEKKEAAGRFNDPMAMKAMANNQRLGDAFKAHAAAGAPGPMTSNVALTKPADMSRANDMSYWTAQSGQTQTPMAPQRLTGMDRIRAMQGQKIGQDALAMFGL